MHVVVAGGAGFVGSHLCDRLIERGDVVSCVDNLVTGRHENIEHLLDHPRFRFIEADVCEPFHVPGTVDVVANLASPASPPHYHRMPLETLAVGSLGTTQLLNLSLVHGARFVLASTSEVYGDPEVHPQREDYWGHVNPIGPRSVYDEAKRYAEAVTKAFARHHGVNVGIARIFNTFGPRMRADDGRVVSSFIVQALGDQDLTIYGNGAQTRSFCYVSDLVRGLVALIDSDAEGPINLGNPDERTVLDLAELVRELTAATGAIVHEALPVDDPTRRRPDISRAAQVLEWQPRVDVVDGLRHTIDWFRGRPDEVDQALDSLLGPQTGDLHRSAQAPAGRGSTELAAASPHAHTNQFADAVAAAPERRSS